MTTTQNFIKQLEVIPKDKNGNVVVDSTLFNWLLYTLRQYDTIEKQTELLKQLTYRNGKTLVDLKRRVDILEANSKKEVRHE